jgi:pyridoxal phosphate enzyme (YggS family)
MVNETVWRELKEELDKKGVTLVAVSKTKSAEDIEALYQLGQRDFGENYVQELVDKQQALPVDIRWHFIGHLQSNKVKYIAPFVYLIHGVDSLSLLQEINKQAAKNNRVVDVLLQMHIANEETKFGLDERELTEIVEKCIEQGTSFNYIRICGLMGMATNTDDVQIIRKEFAHLYANYQFFKQQYFSDKNYFTYCSMGMSSDYAIAIEEGSNMIRIGSLLFGARVYNS